MPHFALLCHDKPGALALRQENRAAHLAYLQESGPKVFAAGPLLDESGQMIGSLLILSLENRDAAEAWAAHDPYARAGLFASVTLTEWKKVIG